LHDKGRIGLISNVSSHQNRRGMAALRAVVASHPSIAHFEVEGVVDLSSILCDFARREAGVVVVNGGDGTVQATLTALINDAPFERPPLLAILPGGMTNLIAHDVGLTGRRERALARLAQAVKTGHAAAEVARHVLSMRLGGDQPVVHGMFLGAAAFYHAVMFARHRVHPTGLDRSAALTSSLALIGLRALIGRGREAGLFRGERMSIALDGADPAPARDYFIALATTLSRLTLGLRPFWGEGPGHFRYTYVEAPPYRLRSTLMPVLRGRPRQWMEANGYVSGWADEMVLGMNSPIVFDGQIFTPEPDRPVTLRADHEVRFLRC
jgi:hypothetical protein